MKHQHETVLELEKVIVSTADNAFCAAEIKEAVAKFRADEFTAEEVYDVIGNMIGMDYEGDLGAIVGYLSENILERMGIDLSAPATDAEKIEPEKTHENENTPH